MNTKQTISTQMLCLLLLFGLLTPIATAQPTLPAQTVALTSSPDHLDAVWTPVSTFVEQEILENKQVEAAVDLLTETKDLLVLTIELQYELYQQ